MLIANNADEQSRAYKAKCSYARKGHTVFVAENGKRGEVHKTFTRSVIRVDGETVQVPAINAAKRWVRTQPAGSVFVDA